MLRPLNPSEVEFRVECHPEELPIAEYCEEATDLETADWIRDQLERGNDWAWCCVHVIARWQDFEAY